MEVAMSLKSNHVGLSLCFGEPNVQLTSLLWCCICSVLFPCTKVTPGLCFESWWAAGMQMNLGNKTRPLCAKD